MEKEVVIVVKKPHDSGSYWTETYQADQALDYICGIKKGIKIKGSYTLGASTYYLSEKGMEKIRKQYGDNLIVVLEDIERLTRKCSDIGYLEKLMQEKGFEFYFWYDKTHWGKDSSISEDYAIKSLIAYKEMRSKEQSEMTKNGMKKKEQFENKGE